MKSLLNKGKECFKDKNKLIMMGVIFFTLLVVLVVPSFANPIPIKSVEITSEKLSYESNTPGAWKVVKSAKWVSKGKAQITLDVSSVIKPRNEYTDVILVLDTSGSMLGTTHYEDRTVVKLNQLQSDVSNLINEMIPKGNKIALITFNDTSTILSDFTSDSTSLVDNINRLTAEGNTNYYQALINVENILKNYSHQDNRDCVVLFLTDGLPNVDTPNEVPQYQNLKANYPYLTINAIQYEMGDSSFEAIKKISDDQFVVNTSNLDKFLYRAAVNPVAYDNFVITDYIDERYFTPTKITTTAGEGKLEGNKVTWDLGKIKSGFLLDTTKAVIDVKLKDEFIGTGGIYPTNERLEINSKIRDSIEEVTSTKTPILADSYQITYEGNAPEGCSVTNVPSARKVSVFDTVSITEEEPKCEGYQFKGWKVVTEGVNKVNEDHFIMPEENVVIRAKWSKLSLSKSTEGKVAKIQSLYQMMADNSVPDNIKSEFVSSNTGINFGNISSDTNGKGIYQAVKLEGEGTPIYYYRGAVNNNNVLFADHCWKIVRTTSTKGVKLIYNGKIKETYSNTTTISQDGYTNISNDITYPYTYDISTNQWTSTNHTDSKTGTISFSVAAEGNYILSYTVSSENNYDKAYFYKDGVELGEYSGTASGTIPLGNLTSSNIIMIKYTKDSSGLNGNDNVVFSIGKASGEVIKSCANTGADSTIGESKFNSKDKSIAYNGYMYGDVYPVSTNGRGDIVGLGGKTERSKYNQSATNYIYATTATYNPDTGKYELGEDKANRVWNDTYAVGAGNQYLYTCFSETESTCDTVSYIIRSTDANYIYYVSFTGGELAEDTLNKEIVYGNDVSYDPTTKMYTLKDTISSKIGNWETDYKNIGNGHHYTCLNEKGICEKVNYINYLGAASTRSYGSFYYATFSDGVKVEDAVEKMTTESAHMTSSTIKTKIDEWYKNNMTAYTTKLEDTTWCNDRTVGAYGGWSKDGDAVSNYNLFYKNSNDVRDNKPQVTCRNKKDAYTTDDIINGNGDLEYPVGLLTADEIQYAGGEWSNNTTYYLYTGDRWWSVSPGYFTGNFAVEFGVSSRGDLDYSGVCGALGVRPSVSLAPGTLAMEGDGSPEDPYIVE